MFKPARSGNHQKYYEQNVIILVLLRLTKGNVLRVIPMSLRLGWILCPAGHVKITRVYIWLWILQIMCHLHSFSKSTIENYYGTTSE